VKLSSSINPKHLKSNFLNYVSYKPRCVIIFTLWMISIFVSYVLIENIYCCKYYKSLISYMKLLRVHLWPLKRTSDRFFHNWFRVRIGSYNGLGLFEVKWREINPILANGEIGSHDIHYNINMISNVTLQMHVQAHAKLYVLCS
jgi:hypothetical protein